MVGFAIYLQNLIFAMPLLLFKEVAYSATSFLDHAYFSLLNFAELAVLCATHRMLVLISFGQSKGAGDMTGTTECSK